MAKSIAYVRISDSHKQDNATQKQRIADYATGQSIIIDSWIESSLSGSKTTRAERGIDHLLTQLQPGDNLLISDIDRLGRTSISDITEIITRIINGGANLHICYSNARLTPADANDLGKIFITIGEAYAAVRFAQERSNKARAAIARRKQQGLTNGRPKGAIVSSKLDQHEHTIIIMASQNASEYAIADHLGIERSTLRRWKQNRQQLINQAKAAGLWQPQLSLVQIKALLKKSRFS